MNKKLAKLTLLVAELEAAVEAGPGDSHPLVWVRSVMAKGQAATDLAATVDDSRLGRDDLATLMGSTMRIRLAVADAKGALQAAMDRAQEVVDTADLHEQPFDNG